jgi:hypothetical protein
VEAGWVALVVAVLAAVALAYWRRQVTTELRAIHAALERLAPRDPFPRLGPRPDAEDAGCYPELPRLHVIPDNQTVWLVLFASVLYRGRPAIEARADEWRTLFGGQ